MTDFTAKWLERCLLAKGVVFDFGGVISIAPGETPPVLTECVKHGLTLEGYRIGWKNYRHLWDGGLMTGVEMYRNIFKDAGIQLGDAECERLMYIDAEAWIANLSSDTLELLKEVKKAGLKTGILSNMSHEFYDNLFCSRAKDYLELADVVVISAHERLYKPNREIYDLTEKRMGIDCKDLIFLDDTLANVEAARSYGWQSEVYKAER
jgi:phosphoglycolate phosphatase-like HAD superfamily hydrolase